MRSSMAVVHTPGENIKSSNRVISLWAESGIVIQAEAAVQSPVWHDNCFHCNLSKWRKAQPRASSP